MNIKKYTEFINENKNNGKIRNNFNRVIKLIDVPDYKYKLELNIQHYFNIFNSLYKNTGLKLNEYEINLLIISTFLRFFNDDISNIEKIENNIRKNNIHELYISSLLILKTIYKIIIIVKKTLKNKNMLFDNIFLLNIIYDFINNKKVNMYDFNSSFKNDLSKDIILFIKKNF